ncbi:unnamed protein product [Calicophoron daubneyi]|uniref:Tyrosine-protein kinase n=1 Tax=Calicophoron daubneyi TaxID=300641 RepID=A0AAV2TKN3_CALDB
MGNCVPSHLDLHELVESPLEVKRSSKLSNRTHDTWTTGDEDMFSSSSSAGDIKTGAVAPKVTRVPSSKQLLEVRIQKASPMRRLTSEVRRLSSLPGIEKKQGIFGNRTEPKGNATITPNNTLKTSEANNSTVFKIGGITATLRKKSSRSLQGPDCLDIVSGSKQTGISESRLLSKQDHRKANSEVLVTELVTCKDRTQEDSGLGSLSACTPVTICNDLEKTISCQNEEARTKEVLQPSQTKFTLGSDNIETTTRVFVKGSSNVACHEGIDGPPVPPKSNYQDSIDWRKREAPTDLGNHLAKRKNESLSSTNKLACIRRAKLDASFHSGTMNYEHMAVGSDQEILFRSSHTKRCSIGSGLAIALEAYAGRNERELSVEMNERLIIVSKRAHTRKPLVTQPLSKQTEEEFWVVERFAREHGSHEGLVPRRILRVVEVCPKEHTAWFGVSREQADRMLLGMGNPSGTYIIRPSSDAYGRIMDVSLPYLDATNAFALSLRYFDLDAQLWLVKHYRVRYKISEGHYYIFRHASFQSIDELLTHHSSQSDGLICKLNVPHPRTFEPLSNLKQLEVNRSSFLFVRRLGRGSFGEVWEALWNRRVPVAIKKLLANGNMENTRFLNEAHLMQQLNHPRIVRLLAVCTKPNSEPAYIITELMEKGSLKTHMHNLDHKKVEFEQLLRMMLWVSEGMVYLEQQHFIHRDLRASNVLVDSQLQLKVADFGLSHMLGDADEYIGNIQTKFPIRWTAPEGMLKQAYSTKSDVWSFGVLMYEILTFCETPYAGLTSREVKEYVCSGKRLGRPQLKVAVPSKFWAQDEYETPRNDATAKLICPSKIYEKMVQCWQTEPDARPTFSELHHYIQELLHNFKK